MEGGGPLSTLTSWRPKRRLVLLLVCMPGVLAAVLVLTTLVLLAVDGHPEGLLAAVAGAAVPVVLWEGWRLVPLASMKVRSAIDSPVPGLGSRSGVRVTGPRSKGAARQLSASSFQNLRSIGEREGWSADRVLGLVDEQLSPYGSGQDAEPPARDVEEQLTDANQNQRPDQNAAERRLTVESYWNLLSMAELNGWNAEVIITLIDEHLKSTESESTQFPDLVYHSESVSGLDWQLLFDWIFRDRGI